MIKIKSICPLRELNSDLIHVKIFFQEHYLPVSTKNGDGINDVFSFGFNASSIANFKCVIVNRWGVVVHEMNDITDEWDGTDKGGSQCRDGVYFYNYNATSDDGTDLIGQGTVQIVSNKE